LGHGDLLNFCDPTYLNSLAPPNQLKLKHAVASAATAASSKSRLRSKPLGERYRLLSEAALQQKNPFVEA